MEKKPCLISYSCYSVNSNKNGHTLKHLHKNVICNVNNHRSHGSKSIAKYFMKDQTHLMFCTVFIPFIYLFYQFLTKTFPFPFCLFMFQWISKQNVKAIKHFFHINMYYVYIVYAIKMLFSHKHVYIVHACICRFLHGNKAYFSFNYVIYKTYISFQFFSLFLFKFIVKLQ